MKKLILIAGVVLIPFLSGCTTYVRTPPPSAEVEVVGVAPYRGAVWVPGHYGRFGHWHPGHWRAAY